jgi:O-antigen ligase
VIWGLPFLVKYRRQLESPPLLLHLALLCAFFLAVPVAHDSERGFTKWLGFSYQTAVFPITYLLLKQYGDPALERLLRAMAGGGLIALGLLYLQLVWYFFSDVFTPILQLQEDNLPFLLPFLLALLVNNPRYRRWLTVALIAAVFLYIFISEGRSALLGFLVALLVFSLLNRNRVVKYMLIGVAAGLLLSMMTYADNLLRLAPQMSTLGDQLDAFSSLRTVLWRQALQHPPDSQLIGVGMGNIRYVPEVLHIGDIQLGHLHNFLLDTWYETGFLGLLALLAFIAYPLVKLNYAWSYLSSTQRFQAGVWLAAASAILTSGLLSFLYSSPSFAMYLPLSLAAVLYLANRQGRQKPGYLEQ